MSEEEVPAEPELLPQPGDAGTLGGALGFGTNLFFCWKMKETGSFVGLFQLHLQEPAAMQRLQICALILLLQPHVCASCLTGSRSSNLRLRARSSLQLWL